MDIASLLNDQAPRVEVQRQSRNDTYKCSAAAAAHPRLQSPINIPTRTFWPNAEQHKSSRCELRTLLCSEPVQRQDSMSFSPKSEPMRRHGQLDNLPKTLPCYQCEKRFSRRSDLVRHERIHSGVRPHSCNYPGCGKAFIQRSALTIHERVHTGVKPHECLQCGKPFSDSSSLARHRRTHTGVRPYRCDFPGCNKDFTRKTTLSRHRQQHVSKRHVPVNNESKVTSNAGSMSTISSYGDLATPRTTSAASSPNLYKPQTQNNSSCYITFQINQPSDSRYGIHHHAHAQYQHHPQLPLPQPTIYRSNSIISSNLQAPPHCLSASSSALLSPPADFAPRRPSEADYFSRRQCPVLAHTRSYSGSPLPRIVTGWDDEQPRAQYGPISVPSDCRGEPERERERRDSAVGATIRPFWSHVGSN